MKIQKFVSLFAGFSLLGIMACQQQPERIPTEQSKEMVRTLNKKNPNSRQKPGNQDDGIDPFAVDARTCLDKAKTLLEANNFPEGLKTAEGCEAVISKGNQASKALMKLEFEALTLQAGFTTPDFIANELTKRQGDKNWLAFVISESTVPPALSTRMSFVATQNDDQKMTLTSSMVAMATALSAISDMTTGNATSVVAALASCSTIPSCTASVATSFSTFQNAACLNQSAAEDQNSLCNKTKKITAELPASPTTAQIVSAVMTYCAGSQN